MGIRVTDRKVLSQLLNGESYSDNTSDFTTNLAGSVMERVQLETTIELEVTSQSTTLFTFNVTGGDTIERLSGVWADDLWAVGDSFNFTASAPSGNTFTGRITAINGNVLEFATLSGTPADADYEDAVMYLLDDQTAAVFEFGLVENADTAGFANKVDGSNQMFQLGGLTNTYQTMPPAAGAKSWITGACEMLQTAAISNGIAEYKVRHEIIILPYYTLDLADYLTNGIMPPDLFGGVNTLKYVFAVRFRKAISNPNGEKVYIDQDNLGSVGWFGENFNGLPNNYDAVLTDYQDTATSDQVTDLQITRKTTVYGTITGTGFGASTKIGLYLSAILTPAAYAANATLYKDLWLYDNVVRLADAEYTGLSGIIKRLKSTLVSATTIDFEIDVEFSAGQQTQLSIGQQFIIAVQTCNPALPQANSDKVIMVADLSELISDTDVPDLLDVFKYKFLSHANEYEDIGFTNARGWVEDNRFLQIGFSLDLSKDAYLRAMRSILMARNSDGDEFPIQTVNYDLSSQVLVPIGGGKSKQAFNLNTTRGYPLPAGDFMNYLRLMAYENVDPLRYAQEAVVSTGVITVTFIDPYDDNSFEVIIIDVLGSGFDTSNITKLSDGSGFTIQAYTEPGEIAYLALRGTFDGLLMKTVTLTAGSNDVTFDTPFADTDYTVIAIDLDGNGIDTSSIVKSANKFTINATATTRITYVAVKNTGISRIRSNQQAITVGANSVTFPSSFSNNDYTLLFKDQENYGNVMSNFVKTAAGFTFDAVATGTLNYIAILNP